MIFVFKQHRKLLKAQTLKIIAYLNEIFLKIRKLLYSDIIFFPPTLSFGNFMSLLSLDGFISCGKSNRHKQLCQKTHRTCLRSVTSHNCSRKFVFWEDHG